MHNERKPLAGIPMLEILWWDTLIIQTSPKVFIMFWISLDFSHCEGLKFNLFAHVTFKMDT